LPTPAVPSITAMAVDASTRVEESVQLGDLGVTSGEAGHVERQLPRQLFPRDRRLFDVGGQQLRVETARVRAWLDAELLGEDRAEPGVPRERLGAAPGPGEHPDQALPQRFPQRMLGDQVGEFRREL
jgi:hypothetical protein